MPQYWSVDCPCAYCPAISNTTHDETCIHYKTYSSTGSLIPYVPPTSQQLTLDFEVTPHIRKSRRGRK